MAKQSSFPIYDRVLDGKLADILAGWRDEGLSNAEIQIRLREDHAITVSSETVRRWIRDEVPAAVVEAAS